MSNQTTETRTLLCTHLVWFSGYCYGQVIGSYMRLFDKRFTTGALYLRNWQRVPSGVEVVTLPLHEHKVITEDVPREYICAQDGLHN